MTPPALNEPKDRPFIGIGLILVAFAVFSFIDTGAKWLGTFAVPALQLAFMRYFGHFVISVGLVFRGGGSQTNFKSEHLPLMLVRGGLLMLSTVFNFVAIQFLSLTVTATILFSSPIMICILSWPLLGERVGAWRWSAICLGFIGILVVIRPFDETFHWAMIFSILAALAFSLYSILTRKLAHKVSIDTMQFYSGAVGTLALLPVAIYTWQNPETLFQWWVMVMLGVLGWLGHEFLTRAYGHAPASTLTPFGYTFIIYLTIWSYLVFEELPDGWTILGTLIVVLAGLVIWFREVQLHRQQQLQWKNTL